MEISHVIRGEDHLSNTPKHILLFRALGARRAAVRPPAADPQPRPDEDEQAQEPDRDRRLPRARASSARRSSTTWRCSAGRPAPRRRSSRSTSSSSGSTSTDVHKAGAVFDRERLEWLNGQWIRRLEPDELVERLRPFLEAELDGGPDRPDARPTRRSARCCPIVRERLPRLGAIGELVGFLFVDDLRVDPALLVPKRWDAATTAEALTAARDDDRRRRRGQLRGRRAGAAAAGPRRGARLEGRRPVHGDPRRGHRPDRDAAAVRHARRARLRADARAPRPGDRRRCRRTRQVRRRNPDAPWRDRPPASRTPNPNRRSR